ncbi:MAG: hypothetical protein BalsKO_12800 [Balneolaceae bacterium]
MKKIFPFLIAILFFSSNCINNVEDLSEPVPVPEGVSYANDVQPIFNAQCTSCHGNFGGISFVNYEATTSGNGNNYGASLIIAGDADNSGLIDKLSSNPQSGSQMPQGGSLTNDEIATIRAWINEGALDN